MSDAPAQEPLRVEMYSSVAAGYSKNAIRAAGNIGLAIISKKLDIDAKFDIDGKSTLMQFGERLINGDIHLGVVFGIEYGWLKKQPRFANLEPIVVGRKAAYDPHWTCFLLAHEAFENDDLREVLMHAESIAVTARLTTMDELAWQQLLVKNGRSPADFKKVECATTKLAVQSVIDREADLLLLGGMEYEVLRDGKRENKLPGLTQVFQSKPFPNHCIIGSSNVVDRVRPGLWGETQRQLMDLSETAEGDELLMFWHIERFAHPKQSKFFTFLRERLQDFPNPPE